MAIALIEGADDRDTYSRFVLPPPHVRLVTCHGRPNLIEVQSILSRRTTPGVLAICDADFDRVRGHVEAGVHYTDFHDAETMMILSDSSLHVQRRLDHLTGVDSTDEDRRSRRDHLLSIAGSIGMIRHYAQEARLPINFKSVTPGAFLHGDEFDLTGYIDAALETLPSATTALTYADLHAIASRPLPAQLGDMAQGHDLCSLFGAAYPHGDHNPRTSEEMAMLFRLGFDASCFRGTTLARLIDEWELATGFDVLSDDAAPI